MKQAIASGILSVMILPFMVTLITTYVHGFVTKEELHQVKIENAKYQTQLNAIHQDVKVIKEEIIKRGL